MPDQVTKKDLQSLQGYVNKQIGDLKKLIEKAQGDISVLKEVPTKQDEAIMETYSKMCEQLRRDVLDLRAEIAALKKATA
jgi:hypothetical protein